MMTCIGHSIGRCCAVTTTPHRCFLPQQQLQRRAPRLRRGCCCRAAQQQHAADVVVVGAGLAGLSCAVHLQERRVRALVVEAGDGVGGRARTDELDGFLLDRGFQIFLSAYPEAQVMLDYDELNLKPFYAGAMVWCGGRLQKVSDPLRHLIDGLLSLTNDVGTAQDKVKVGLFRLKCLFTSADALLKKAETTVAERLREEGFSTSIIQKFFRPFLGGIFFDRQLQTSSRLFEFVMKMLATGDNCLPEQGIGAIAQQLQAKLPKDSIRLGTRVERVIGSAEKNEARVILSDGTELEAPKGVVVAVEGPEAKRLIGSPLEARPSKSEPGVGTCCAYFTAPSAPSPENILYLNGEDSGIVNNCCFPSTVSPSYAPADQVLVSVSTVGTYNNLTDQQLEDTIKDELSKWFGREHVGKWRHLRTYRIPFAQPNQAPPTDFFRPVSLGDSLFICGDHRGAATFDSALASGKRAAEAVLSQSRIGRVRQAVTVQ